MKLTSFAATAIAVALLTAGSVMADETLKTGDSHNMDKWYGRAGGLAGSDRVEVLGKATGDRVGVSYDQDVAKRTNMPREGAGNSDIGITYDKDVANRTNMQRDLPPTQSAGTPTTPHN